jgi:hypothetical protein
MGIALSRLDHHQYFLLTARPLAIGSSPATTADLMACRPIRFRAANIRLLMR